MDYKSILKSRKTRLQLLHLLAKVPDKPMLQIQYRIKTGHKLDLQNPQRFTEKLQWYKLYYRDPLMAVCSDKYEVREYVRSCGLSYILNECYGVFDQVDQIPFHSFPDQFVLKDTLGGGGNSIIICPDKSHLQLEDTKRTLQSWLDIGQEKTHPGREWVYCRNNHRIIAERFLEPASNTHGLTDYKFFCFYGKAEFLYVITNRVLGKRAQCGIYSKDFELLQVKLKIKDPLTDVIPRPENYQEMLNLAEQLAGKFPQVRVDLYNLNGQILFGELTFFDASGYSLYDPDTFDYEIGAKFPLPKKLY